MQSLFAFVCLTLVSGVLASISALPAADVVVPVTGHVPRRASKRFASPTGRKQTPQSALRLDGAAFDKEYLVNITVGGKPFQVILDTGSSDTWVAHTNFSCFNLTCASIPASACDFGPATFDPSASPTFTVFPNATFFVRYGSGESLRGPAGFDTVSVGGVRVHQQEIGVPNHNAFLGDGFSEGVLGLAFPSLTSVYNNTSDGLVQMRYSPFFQTAFQRGNVKKPYFSNSLNRPTLAQATNDPVDANLGVLAFGGIVPVPVTGVETTVPVTQWLFNAAGSLVPTANSSAGEYAWYSLNVTGYDFPGSMSIPTSSNNTFVDSGTTVNYVATPVAAAYNALFVPPGAFDQELQSFVVPCNATAAVLNVVINGKRFEIDPRDQVVPLQKGSDGKEICISGTQDGGPDVAGNTFVLGDVFLHNVVTTYNPIDAEITFTQRQPY
ncbi:unnamed protein product [Mycena citricolor]|uniref:Peptidase A1 domain-containing protein n=1 Tax=Mycena citricolor TaxID=2018698 RepID=A0AAD2GXI9_9AGAR|nr:unnamed protein product [Mycena citricolor]